MPTSAVSSVRLQSEAVEAPTVNGDAGVNAFVMTWITRLTATPHHYTVHTPTNQTDNSHAAMSDTSATVVSK